MPIMSLLNQEVEKNLNCGFSKWWAKDPRSVRYPKIKV